MVSDLVLDTSTNNKKGAVPMGKHKQQSKTKATQAKRSAALRKTKSTNNINKKAAASKKESKSIADKLPLKKWWFWIIIVILLCILGSVISSTGKKNKEVPQEYTSLKELDLNGMTIAEACAAVREAGWRVGTVRNDNNYSEQSDCSNTEYKVTKGSFNKEKYWTYNGSLRNDYETVTIYYAGAKKQEEAKTEEKKEETTSSSSSSRATSAQSTTSSSSSSPTASVNSDFRKIMEGYESFMNSYVDFMKKYKNASSAETMSMLSDYADMMSKYSEWAAKIDKYNPNNLSAEDWAYYLEVTSRVLKKLAEVQ